MIHVKKNIRDSLSVCSFFVGGGGGELQMTFKKIKTACGLDWGKLRRK